MERNKIRQYKKDRTLLKFILSVIVALIMISVGIYFHYKYPAIKTVNITIDNSSAMFSEKINMLEKSVVEQVRKCESNGYKESDGLIKFDSNKVASIGTMQFQVKTIIYYEKSLFGRVITGKDAVIIALDDTKAGELAQAIMFQSPNLANDWLNCSNNLRLSDQIKTIKAIK